MQNKHITGGPILLEKGTTTQSLESTNYMERKYINTE